MKKILLFTILILTLATLSFAGDKKLNLDDSIMIVSQDGTMVLSSVKKEDIVIINGKFTEKPQDASVSYESVNLTQSGNFTIGKTIIPLYIKE